MVHFTKLMKTFLSLETSTSSVQYCLELWHDPVPFSPYKKIKCWTSLQVIAGFQRYAKLVYSSNNSLERDPLSNNS